MDTNYLENNYLTLVGKVTGEKKFSHEIYGESFYIFNLMIPRLSGNSDIIPITVSERLIKEDTLQEGNKLLVKGQFRSYNSYENERNRLILTVFAKDITELEDDNEEEIEENEMVKICSHKGNVFAVEGPDFVELEITETEPGFKGDTATGATKPATVETGANVNVPLFVEQGDKIKIDTRTGEYLSRV